MVRSDGERRDSPFSDSGRMGEKDAKMIDRKAIEESKRRFASAVEGLIKDLPEHLGPLSTLNEEQRRAVLIYGQLIRGMPILKCSNVKDPDVQIGVVIEDFAPSFGGPIKASDPCFDAEIAYLSALGKCEREGRSERECFEANGYLDFLARCTMEMIENMKKSHEIGIEWPRPLPRPDDPIPELIEGMAGTEGSPIFIGTVVGTNRIRVKGKEMECFKEAPQVSHPLTPLPLGDHIGELVAVTGSPHGGLYKASLLGEEAILDRMIQMYGGSGPEMVLRDLIAIGTWPTPERPDDLTKGPGGSVAIDTVPIPERALELKRLMYVFLGMHSRRR